MVGVRKDLAEVIGFAQLVNNQSGEGTSTTPTYLVPRFQDSRKLLIIIPLFTWLDE